MLALANLVLLLASTSSLHTGLYSHTRLQCSVSTNDDTPTISSSSSTNSNINYIPALTADDTFVFRPIGVVGDSYDHKFDTPKQATISRHEGGRRNATIRIFPEFIDCLDKLDEFDFVWVISVMNRNSGYKKKIIPQPRIQANGEAIVPKEVGLFASRAPHRPNPIALSAIQLVQVDMMEGIVHVTGLDLLNGTPVLDLKPYIPAFDSFPDARAGWMDVITTAEDARINGYQSITNARGRRRARRRGRLGEGI